MNTPTAHTAAMMMKASLKQWAPEHFPSAAVAACCNNVTDDDDESPNRKEEKEAAAAAEECSDEEVGIIAGSELYVHKVFFPISVSLWRSRSKRGPTRLENKKEPIALEMVIVQ